jgi:hypothetical protein
MGKFVFTYNAKYNKDTDGDEFRRTVIIFLHKVGAKNIQQCLDTTFVFDCDETTDKLYTLIEIQLDGKGRIFDQGYYLLTRVYWTSQSSFKIKRKCNPDLQDFVEKTLSEKI